jgi:hypothetical protein
LASEKSKKIKLSGLASKKWRGFYCLGGYFDETAAIYTRV